jgi:hypothetical protein
MTVARSLLADESAIAGNSEMADSIPSDVNISPDPVEQQTEKYKTEKWRLLFFCLTFFCLVAQTTIKARRRTKSPQTNIFRLSRITL